MKKIVIAVVIIIAAVMVITNPSRTQHESEMGSRGFIFSDYTNLVVCSINTTHNFERHRKVKSFGILGNVFQISAKSTDYEG